MKRKKSIVIDRERTDRYFEPIVRRLPPGISPDFITAISFIPLLAYFFLVWFSGRYGFSWANFLILFPAFIALFLAAGLDGLDGALARKRKKQGRRTDAQLQLGNFLDHTLDRISDIILLICIPLGGYCSWWLVLFALIGISLTSFCGTEAEAVYNFREYGGILGRLRRLGILLAVTFMSAVYPGEIAGFSFFGWTMIIFGGGGLITFGQRFYKTYKKGNDLIKSKR